MAETKPECVIQDYPPPQTAGWDWEFQCARCGSSADYERCDNCDEGYDGHDCGEDCCMCRYPEENVPCDYCRGRGGWYRCLSSPEWCNANPLEGREGVERGEIEWFPVKAENMEAEHG